MGTLQQRSAVAVVAFWLLAVLLSQQRAAAADPPPGPLSLRLQGRPFNLEGDHQYIWLPLGCPGAGTLLDVQHRVPLGAGLCTAALSVLLGVPGSSSHSLWSSEKVREGCRTSTGRGPTRPAGALFFALGRWAPCSL